MRTVRRLRLRYLLFTSTPDVLPLSLSHHVETKYGPTEIYYTIHFGGPAGGRTRVHNAFARKELQQLLDCFCVLVLQALL